ncbi:zinc-regulated TonB-dependent outer membrane receptor [Myxococcus xanthus]|uniref:Zinc-regulated TonB-dependent outer membrane receptor n=1 Tax=Myxococcus xanthus TaxID=34 RepID=A0AAE6KSB3_MYXXA|nr:zinc-regulated TonB-dependent outer membrane receptor [Myxococcus xanthus]QDE75323.1 zinc-regulated TonB-dependent outer membrane receptor [Myxococcus xanthus]QDE82628.1 zinc-regulated TonB-dependent outer membrane receptor [Myxococcus xanthus]QDE96898.1 zinc-regulated TonB-dependent outer membrane receptor [Myxococcus xanthus]QDF04430.1 zinc-regulated TonB-dependent outer membrane receptor [Myxococcus xanthus]
MATLSRRAHGALMAVSLTPFLFASGASAQDASAPPADAPVQESREDAAPALTPEELEEIEKALGSDAAAAQQNAPTGTAAPPASMPGGGSALSIPGVNTPNTGANFLDLSFILDVAAAAFTDKEPLQSGAHDPTRNGFNLQQLELSIGSVVDPYFRFDANIVFSQFGVEIEEAYGTTLALPYNLQVRAGQFLTRFGRINPTHPHSWDFVDQPFAVGRIFGGESNRGLGAEVSWLAPLPWYVEVIGSTTDATGEATARSFLGATSERVQSPFDLQLTGAVKQFFPLSDDLSLMWGLSTATGPNPTGYRNRTDVFGTDLYLRYRPITQAYNTTLITFQAEAYYRRRQVPGDVLTDFNTYAQAAWRFSPRWATALRYELGTAARGEDGARVIDPLDPDWTESRNRVSANVTFWPTEFSRLRLQGARDHAGWRDEAGYSLMLALELVTGAHGAHAF